MTTATATTGRYEIRLDGKAFGQPWHLLDVAANSVLEARQLVPGCWELIDLTTGEQVPCDALEAQALRARDQYEATEEQFADPFQSRWNAPVPAPVPCQLCTRIVIASETSRHSDVDGGLVHTSCYQEAEAVSAVSA